MQYILSSAPHDHSTRHVSHLMRQVLYALLPGIATYVWFFGWGVVVQLTLASVTALSVEALMLWLRRRPILFFLQDNSALVTAWLFALAVSPFLPWWMTVLGISFALIFAKHLYGGLGYNPFNPAMVGYALLLIAYPAEMSRWPALTDLSGHTISVLDSISIIFFGTSHSGIKLDALTGATALDTMKTALTQFETVIEIRTNPLFGDFGARGWEWIGNAYFIGGLWLIYRKVISWHIPVSMLGSLVLLATVFYIFDPGTHPFPLFHLFSGAAILGAFFIATDPVSAATSNLGRLWYGMGIGALVFVIRSWGGYPDGIAFAVLLMNMSAPALDYVTRPRVFGYDNKER